MKKLFFIFLILTSYGSAEAYKLQIYKAGSVDGYYDWVRRQDLANDEHILQCYGPGPNPCTVTGCCSSSCVTATQAEALNAYAMAEIGDGNDSGTYTTSNGVTVTWSANGDEIEIVIEKNCDQKPKMVL